MRSLASFVMRGPWQAIMAATVVAILSVLAAPLSILSAAVIGLVTLRLGAKEGLFVTGGTWLASSIISYLVFGSLMPAVGFALVLWLPVLALALVLRSSRSLAYSLELALLFALISLGYFYLMFDDPAQHWAQQLREPLQLLAKDSGMAAQDFETLLTALSTWMTAVLSAGFFLQLSLSLFMARWWQALLFNPGGFGDEFRQMRLHMGLAYVSAPLLIWYALGQPPQWAQELVTLVIAAYFLQGLAVAHGILKKLDAHVAWIAGVYVLLFIALPYVLMVLAMTGFADAWMNFRRSVTTSGNGSD